MNSDEILKKIKEMYLSGQNKITLSKAKEVVKRSLLIKIINEYRNKKILFVVSSEKDIEHFNNIINMQQFDIKNKTLNLKFITYKEIENLTSNDIRNLDIDLLLINEIEIQEEIFWKRKIIDIMRLHPHILLLNMSNNTSTKKTSKIGPWEQKYLLAKAYYMKYGNLEIPNKFKTMNGIDYSTYGHALGAWLGAQRLEYKKGKLSKERIALLEKIGMRFETKSNDKVWYDTYLLAKVYYEKYGDLEVPQNFKTINGVDYNEDGLALGVWVVNQRQRYKINKLSNERIELLKKIGMRFDNNYKIYNWKEMYKISTNYFNKYGDLEVEINFKTTNGVDYDENGYHLGKWIATQRREYQKKNLSKDKVELLKEIGMRFEYKHNIVDWEDAYRLAKNYYKTYGNLKIIQRFKTIDGINYDEEGYTLGIWITSQRRMYKQGKLSESRIKMLERIGMIWGIIDRVGKKEELCSEYLIPYKDVIRISYDELHAKTMYLLDNNINIIIDSKLNPIYNMSNTNMQVTYGVSLEELIEKYKKKEKEK